MNINVYMHMHVRNCMYVNVYAYIYIYIYITKNISALAPSYISLLLTPDELRSSLRLCLTVRCLAEPYAARVGSRPLDHGGNRELIRDYGIDR